MSLTPELEQFVHLWVLGLISDGERSGSRRPAATRGTPPDPTGRDRGTAAQRRRVIEQADRCEFSDEDGVLEKIRPEQMLHAVAPAMQITRFFRSLSNRAAPIALFPL